VVVVELKTEFQSVRAGESIPCRQSQQMLRVCCALVRCAGEVQRVREACVQSIFEKGVVHFYCVTPDDVDQKCRIQLSELECAGKSETTCQCAGVAQHSRKHVIVRVHARDDVPVGIELPSGKQHDEMLHRP